MARAINDTKTAYFEEQGFQRIEKAKTFTGASGSGAVGTIDLFTVTGAVEVRLAAYCTTNLAGASATLEVGVAGATTALIAQTTATDIDAGEIWEDATPSFTTPHYLLTTAALSGNLIGYSLDIIATVGTANITAGAMVFVLFWRPISSNGEVTSA